MVSKTSKSFAVVDKMINRSEVVIKFFWNTFFEQVVFRNGEGALQTLPPLIDVIPEARLNLVIYYLKQGTCFLIVHVF